MTSRLSAKLTIRRTRGAVDRERLFARLDEESDRSIMWIQGPAGSGKSTLVSSYVNNRRLPSLWYHVDDADVDAATVFTCLAQAAAPLTRKHGPRLPTLMADNLTDLPGFTRRFFARFSEALPPRVAVVMDSLDNAPSNMLQDLLLVALAELRPGQRLFVTTRESPPDRMAHLPARGAMAVLGWDDLRLTMDEAQVIAGNSQILDEGLTRDLLDSTSGWAAGFVLMLAHLSRATPGSSTRRDLPVAQLFPYYMNELFAHTNSAIQLLLVKTALLPQFTAAQATAFGSGAAEVASVLDRLMRAHFFISCSDGTPPAYRYHGLFRKFLLEQGRLRWTDEERRTHLQFGAKLLMDDGDAETALSLLIEAGDARAEQLLCRLAPGLLEQGRNTTLEKFIRALPPRDGEPASWLRFWSGLACLSLFPERARELLKQAYTGFGIEGAEQGRLLACAWILASYLHGLSEMDPIDRWADTLKSLLDEQRAELPAEVELRVLSCIAVLMFRGGRHAAMIDDGLRRAVKLLGIVDKPVQRLSAACFIVLVHYLRGEWAAGRRFIDETESRLPPAELAPQNIALWHAIKARLMIWEGRYDTAIATSEYAGQMAADHNVGVIASFCASAGVFAAVNAGLPVRAQDFLTRMRTGVKHSRRVDVATIDLQSGLVEMAFGDASAACDCLRAAVDKAVELGAELLAAQFRIVLAIARVLTGQLAAAKDELQQVLDYAQSANLSVLAHGAHMVRAWISHRGGAVEEAIASLQVALRLGREHGYHVVFPWVPQVLLQELGLLALRHGIEPGQVRAMLRLRRVPAPHPAADDWPWRVRVFALGRFDLIIDDRPTNVATKAQKKPLELLKVLVAQGGAGAMASAKIQEYLWPDLDGAAAQNAFNVSLHRLRRLLGDEQALVLHEGRLRLDAERVWTDTASCEQLLESIVAEASPAAAERLMRSYPGPLLPDDDSAWAMIGRERLRSRFLRAAVAMTASLAASGQSAVAVEIQRRVIEIEPLAESMHRELIRNLHALGREAEALDAYRRCVDLLRRLLGRAPSAQTEQLRRNLGM